MSRGAWKRKVVEPRPEYATGARFCNGDFVRVTKMTQVATPDADNYARVREVYDRDGLLWVDRYWSNGARGGQQTLEQSWVELVSDPRACDWWFKGGFWWLVLPMHWFYLQSSGTTHAQRERLFQCIAERLRSFRDTRNCDASFGSMNASAETWADCEARAAAENIGWRAVRSVVATVVAEQKKP